MVALFWSQGHRLKLRDQASPVGCCRKVTKELLVYTHTQTSPLCVVGCMAGVSISNIQPYCYKPMYGGER